MKIAVLTGNQPRHLALVSALSEVAEKVLLVQECKTLHTGIIADRIKASDVMETYFSCVAEAEKTVFGSVQFLSNNIDHLALRYGDLSLLPVEQLAPLFDCEVIIIFGTSYIKGPLCEALVKHNALNVHMGVSPYYRGSACNFWALYNRQPEYVGATIHKLSRGLDSGEILFHVLPETQQVHLFNYGMYAVKAAQTALVEKIKTGELATLSPVQQDKDKEISYSKNVDFTEVIASEYLETFLHQKTHLETPQHDLAQYIHPVIC